MDFLSLSDAVNFITSKVGMSNIDVNNYISTENMLPNKSGITIASSLPDTNFVREYLPNDILISNIRPYFKKIWLANKKGGCSNDIFVLRVNEHHNPKFIYYVLSMDDFFNYVMANSKGTKMPRGDKKAIKNYLIPNFSLKKQINISNFLSSLDKKIDINRKINQNLEEIGFAYYKHEFLDYSSYNEEDLIYSDASYIPKDWSVETLDSICNVAIGKTPPRKEKEWFSTNDSDVKWVSIKDLGNSGIYIFETSECLTHDAIDNFNIKVVPKDSLLLSFKLTIGRLAIVSEPIVTNEAIAHCVFKEDNFISKEYLYYYLKNFNFDTLGSTSSIAKAINSKIVKKIPVIVPSKDKLNNFTRKIKPIFDEIKNNQKEIENLENLRDLLLPKLMNGEIDVSKIQIEE